MQRLGEKALKQVQSYAIEWKQPINFPKIVWQWIHRRVNPPSLDLVVDEHRIKRTSVLNTCATMSMNDYRSVNIAKKCSKK
jgi:hypothetical protein